MSSAKKEKIKFALCLHISRFDFSLFYRAKPVNEMKRQRNRVHCGLPDKKDFWNSHGGQ